MKNNFTQFSPLIPVFGSYLACFLIGHTVDGMWQIAAMLFFYCALGQSFNIFLGMTGYVNFGYVAFMGIGTYGMAVTITHLAEMDYGIGIIILGFVLSLVFSAVLSLIIGAVALRLREAYFAIATVGISEGLRYLIEGAKVWNGSEGIIFIREINQILGETSASNLMIFWADTLVMAIGILAVMVTFLFMISKIGYALTALREDEDAAKVMGINVTRYKMIAFMTSACFAGLIGAASWALKTPYVFPPDVFDIHYTIEAIIIVLLGGAGTLLGPVCGGLIYGLSKYYLSIYLSGFQLLIFAPIIIGIIILFPEGIIGMLKQKTKQTPFSRFIV